MALDAILSGAVAMASLVIALFFLRFWRSTQDRFFLYFSLSFALESANRILLALVAAQNEEAPFFYLIRLVSYGLILVAIFKKNRHRSTPKRREQHNASSMSQPED